MSSARLLLATSLFLSALVYFPITGCYFHTDDFVNLSQIVNYPLARYLVTPYGTHLLIFRNLVFHLSYDLWGPNPLPFFWMVFATHLANVALLFAAIRLFTGSPRLACFGAVLWGTAPVAAGALGWYAVYGHVMVGTLLLIVLRTLAGHLASKTSVTTAEAAVTCLLLLLAATSFGVGIGVALAIPLALLLACPSATRATRLVLLAPLVLVPILYRGAYYVAETRWEFSPTVRSFQTFLAGYWQDEAAMLWHLLRLGLVRLVGGFWLPASIDPSPAGLAIVTLGGAGLIATVAAPPPNVSRRLLTALALIGTSAYGIIAAGRAALAAARPLHGAEMPRYHYVGSVVLCVILCLVLARLGAWLRLRDGWSRGLLTGFLVLTVTSWAISDWHVDQHPEDRAAVHDVIADINHGIAAAPPGRLVFLNNAPFAMAGFMGQDKPLGGIAGLFTIFFSSNVVDGRQVFFVEPDTARRDRALPGSRLAALFVSAPPEP